MGLFSFTQEIAMDLGTANTIIITNGKIVVDEPSVVALDRRTDKMIAVGEKAKLMHEKTHENIRTIRPLRDGVIADFYACEQMMRGLIKQVNTRNHLFSPSLRMVIGVPSGSTEVELRAVRDSAEHAGGLGTACSSNIGNQYALFEAIHGTAPFLMSHGRGEYANPCSLIRAVGQMLIHIGYADRNDLLEKALEICTVTEKKLVVTTEIKDASAAEFTDYLLDTIRILKNN